MSMNFHGEGNTKKSFSFQLPSTAPETSTSTSRGQGFASFNIRDLEQNLSLESGEHVDEIGTLRVAIKSLNDSIKVNRDRCPPLAGRNPPLIKAGLLLESID